MSVVATPGREALQHPGPRPQRDQSARRARGHPARAARRRGGSARRGARLCTGETRRSGKAIERRSSGPPRPLIPLRPDYRGGVARFAHGRTVPSRARSRAGRGRRKPQVRCPGGRRPHPPGPAEVARALGQAARTRGGSGRGRWRRRPRADQWTFLVGQHPEVVLARREAGVVPVEDGDYLAGVVDEDVVAVQVVVHEDVRHFDA